MRSHLLLLFLTSLLLLNCSVKSNDEQVLNVYIRKPLKSINPSTASDFYERRTVRQIFETLYSYDYIKRPYQVVPLLADSYPEIDKTGLVYTIRLKKGVYFADDPCFVSNDGKGKELTAEDVEYSLKYFVSAAPFKSAYFVYYIKGLMELRERAKTHVANGGVISDFIMANKVEGIEVVDRYTIRFKLRQPAPYFLETIATTEASIIAREAIDYYGLEIISHPVGTGPFMIKKWSNKENIIVLAKNKSYKHGFYPKDESIDAGKNLPLLDTVNIHIISDAETRNKNFIEGKLDIYTPDEDHYYDYFGVYAGSLKMGKLVGIESSVVPNLDFNGLLFNMDNKLVKNSKYLRQAISLAFDHKVNLKVFNYKDAVASNWIIPPGIFGYDEKYKNPFTNFDREKAKKLLIKAGYPDGKGLPTLTILLTNADAMKRLGSFFVESMLAIGIKVTPVYLNDQSDIVKYVESNKESAHLFIWREFALFSTPDKILRLFYKGKLDYKSNYSSYYNPEYEKLYEQIVLMPNLNGKLTLINKMRDIVVEDVAFIPLYFSVLYRAYHGYVKNYKPNLMYFDSYKYLRIDLKEKSEILKKLKKEDE